MPPRRSKLPTLLPEGLVVTDTHRKSWKLGKKLGQGGFGLIYLASPASDLPTGGDATYVIKVEHHQNGPLFCELKFYQRAAKQEEVAKWIVSRKLKYLGIPRYWGSGEITFNSISYRFMVIDRLGSDLQNFQKNNNGKLPLAAAMEIGIRMLDVLEYIHEHEYVHGDIKAENILCHLSDPCKVYLADYGHSYRYCPDGKHKEYKEDPRKCHNGTIEFTSLDAHKGAAPSRRGDLQILSFCLLYWLSGRLLWDQNLKFPSAVQAAKQKLVDELPKSVIAWLGQEDGCHVAKFMAEVSTLEYSMKPNYERLKGILLNALECAGTKLSAPFIISNGKSITRKPDTAKAERFRKINETDSIPKKDAEQMEFIANGFQGKNRVQATLVADFQPEPLGIHKPKEKQNQIETLRCSNKTSIREGLAASQERQDIYKYGLSIPILFLMIYYLIYCL